MGVLRSKENGVKGFREQGAWLLKSQEEGSNRKYFREQGAENSGYYIQHLLSISPKDFDLIPLADIK